MSPDSLQVILYICAAVSTIGAAVSVLSNMTAKVKEPYVDITRRLSMIEAKQNDYDRFLKTDSSRLDLIEAESAVMLKSMFALLSHATDGNDVKRCKNAKYELQEFLAKKGVHIG